ncbi:MAG: flippase-like domain-containing protein [Anaerolineaceae bacterium]|nr:flippase-like domain-containing protein [Anaerolineaceae bacterium]
MTKSTRKYLWLAVRVLVSGLCIALVVYKGDIVTRKSLRILGNVFSEGYWPWLIAAVVAYAMSPLFGAWRWRRLLKIQSINLTFRESWRLTYIGFFFNTFMPGVTGGDIIKAYYASKYTEHKAEAVATVFLDRVLGMLGLGLLCICVLATHWRDPAIADGRWTIPGLLDLSIRDIILAFLGFAAAGAMVVYSRRVRRWLFVERLLASLPFQKLIKRLDAAVFIYRHHRRTVLFAIFQSWCAHTVSIASVYFCARALGLDPKPVYFFIYMPVVWIISAFIPSVGGLGPMEWLSQKFFTAAVLVVASPQRALSLAVWIILLFRVAMFIAVLPGAVLHILHPEVSVKEARSEMESLEPING